MHDQQQPKHPQYHVKHSNRYTADRTRPSNAARCTEQSVPPPAHGLAELRVPGRVFGHGGAQRRHGVLEKVKMCLLLRLYGVKKHLIGTGWCQKVFYCRQMVVKSALLKLDDVNKCAVDTRWCQKCRIHTGYVYDTSR